MLVVFPLRVNLHCAIKSIRHDAQKVVGPLGKVGFAALAHPIVEHFAFKFRKRFDDESHIVIDRNLAIAGERFEDDVFPAFGDDGLAERLVDRVLNRFSIKIALFGNESEMVVIARFPIDASAYFVQIELTAENGMPRRDVVFALEVAIERLAGNACVFAYFGNGDAIK